MKTAKISNFFHDKPLFGLDIGHGSVKVMQMADQSHNSGHKLHPPKIIGYGYTEFDNSAQEDGVVIKPEIIAKATLDMFKNTLIGDIILLEALICIARPLAQRTVLIPLVLASAVAESE